MNRRDVKDLADACQLAASGEGKAIRENAGVPQTAVASAIGTTASAVSRWESGTRVPRGMAAARWARLMRALESQADESRVVEIDRLGVQ